MAKEAKRPQKTEVLSMRMDPKTRFVLDVLARVRGQSISTVVERAIQEAADNTQIGGDGPFSKDTKTWKDYWHVNEGVRWLMLASDQNLYPTFEDEYRVAFTKTHWPFFYHSKKFDSYNEWSIEILWPRFEEFLDIWAKTKSSDYFAAGNAMRKALSDARVKPPDWPPKSDSKPSASFDRSEMDDEIPF